MKVKTLLPILFFLLSFPLGSAWAQVEQQTFSETQAGFKISTPNEHWNFVPRGNDPGALRATLRFEFAVDQFTPNLTVMVFPIFENFEDIEKLVDKDLEQFPKTLQVVEKKVLDRSNSRGYRILLRDEEKRMTFEQWSFWIQDKKYVLTCAAKSASFERFRQDCNQIVQSFEILSKAKE